MGRMTQYMERRIAQEDTSIEGVASPFVRSVAHRPTRKDLDITSRKKTCGTCST